MKLSTLFTFAIVGTLFFVPQVNADILVNESFDHMDGGLAGLSPTPGPGGAWSINSGTGSPIMVMGGTALLDQGSGSREDLETNFANQGATDTTYAGFQFSLPTGQTVDPDGNGLYFAGFNADGGFFFRARTGVLAPAGAGDFGLAINADSSNLGDGATWASDLNFDTTYQVVISWNAATGESMLWLDPTDILSTSISHTGGFSGNLINGFFLRQSNDYTGSQIIDNLFVATTFNEALNGPPAIPEPTAAVFLMGVFGLGLVRRRR